MADPRNRAYLAARLTVIATRGAGSPTIAELATFLQILAGLGFAPSAELLSVLRTQASAQLAELVGEWEPVLRERIGADVTYTPMYPNFPRQVMEASEAELYLNAIVHYICAAVGYRWLPEYEAVARPPLTETLDLRIIERGSIADFEARATRLIGGAVAISASDRTLVTSALTHAADARVLLPDGIPNKENLAFTAGVLQGLGKGDLLARHFKTATDVLRLAVALSEGDLSLAEPTRFRVFRRPERRMLLGLVEGIADPVEDMLRYRRRWIRLGERLHPGEYKKRYPAAHAAFRVIRSAAKPPTFNRAVEAAFAKNDIPAALEVLQTRPGELARRMDHLLRIASDSAPVLAAFTAGTDRMATPLLLQVMAHFESRRTGPPALRTFFPKGQSARIKTLPFALPDLPEGAAIAVEAACRSALLTRFAGRAPLGRVFIDPRLADHPVPFSLRSSSRTLRSLTRGARVPIPEGSTIRFFLWWKEGEVDGRATDEVDIDLSAVLYGPDWGYVDHVSYTNLKPEAFRAAHSGDITSAPDGACEFIDLDIASVVEHGVRYAVMSVLSYNEQPFDRLPECHAGWMMRRAPDDGEVFEPATVVDILDVSSPTTVHIPVVLDLVARQLIWVDLGLRSEPQYQVNVEANHRNMSDVALAISTLVRPTLLDLLGLHAEARGTRVAERDRADVVFDAAEIPFQPETIIADYL